LGLAWGDSVGIAVVKPLREKGDGRAAGPLNFRQLQAGGFF